MRALRVETVVAERRVCESGSMRTHTVSVHRSWSFGSLALVAVGAVSCGPPSNSVASENSARLAYMGLDQAIDKALNLGMQGFNMATSANIAPQMATGAVSGTLTVGGQVDQGASPNKQMRLTTEFVTYSDGFAASADAGTLRVTYAAGPETTPSLNLALRNIPNGTFTGTFVRSLQMSGGLMGTVTLDVSFTGSIRAVSGSASAIERTPGTTVITGSAVSDYGTYTINITR